MCVCVSYVCVCVCVCVCEVMRFCKTNIKRSADLADSLLGEKLTLKRSLSTSLLINFYACTEQKLGLERRSSRTQQQPA